MTHDITRARQSAAHLRNAQRDIDKAIKKLTDAQEHALLAMGHETDAFAWQAWGQTLGAIQQARLAVKAMTITKDATGTGTTEARR